MKKYILGIGTIMFTAVFAFGVSAFNKTSESQRPQNPTNVDLEWFIYDGSTPAGESTPANYTLYTGTGEPQDCGGQGMRCAIFAQSDGASPAHPILNTVDESKTKEQTFVE